MTVILPRYKSSNKVLEEALNNFAEGIEQALNRQFQVGRNMLMSQDETTVIFESTGEGGAAASAESCPFDISVSTVPTGGEEASVTEVFINLNPGTVNQLLPSNMFDEISESNEGLHYIFLDCTTNGREVTAVEWGVSGTAPEAIGVDEAAAPLSFKVLLGVLMDGVATKTIGCGSISAMPKESFRTDRPSPTPGLTPYISWYTWVLTTL